MEPGLSSMRALMHDSAALNRRVMRTRESGASFRGGGARRNEETAAARASHQFTEELLGEEIPEYVPACRCESPPSRVSSFDVPSDETATETNTQGMTAKQLQKTMYDRFVLDATPEMATDQTLLAKMQDSIAALDKTFRDTMAEQLDRVKQAAKSLSVNQILNGIRESVAARAVLFVAQRTESPVLKALLVTHTLSPVDKERTWLKVTKAVARKFGSGLNPTDIEYAGYLAAIAENIYRNLSTVARAYSLDTPLSLTIDLLDVAVTKVVDLGVTAYLNTPEVQPTVQQVISANKAAAAAVKGGADESSQDDEHDAIKMLESVLQLTIFAVNGPVELGKGMVKYRLKNLQDEIRDAVQSAKETGNTEKGDKLAEDLRLMLDNPNYAGRRMAVDSAIESVDALITAHKTVYQKVFLAASVFFVAFVLPNFASVTLGQILLTGVVLGFSSDKVRDYVGDIVSQVPGYSYAKKAFNSVKSYFSGGALLALPTAVVTFFTETLTLTNLVSTVAGALFTVIQSVASVVLNPTSLSWLIQALWMGVSAYGTVLLGVCKSLLIVAMTNLVVTGGLVTVGGVVYVAYQAYKKLYTLWFERPHYVVAGALGFNVKVSQYSTWSEDLKWWIMEYVKILITIPFTLANKTIQWGAGLVSDYVLKPMIDKIQTWLARFGGANSMFTRAMAKLKIGVDVGKLVVVLTVCICGVSAVATVAGVAAVATQTITAIVNGLSSFGSMIGLVGGASVVVFQGGAGDCELPEEAWNLAWFMGMPGVQSVPRPVRYQASHYRSLSDRSSHMHVSGGGGASSSSLRPFMLTRLPS